MQHPPPYQSFFEFMPLLHVFINICKPTQCVNTVTSTHTVINVRLHRGRLLKSPRATQLSCCPIYQRSHWQTEPCCRSEVHNVEGEIDCNYLSLLRGTSSTVAVHLVSQWKKNEFCMMYQQHLSKNLSACSWLEMCQFCRKGGQKHRQRCSGSLTHWPPE